MERVLHASYLNYKHRELDYTLPPSISLLACDPSIHPTILSNESHRYKIRTIRYLILPSSSSFICCRVSRLSDIFIIIPIPPLWPLLLLLLIVHPSPVSCLLHPIHITKNTLKLIRIWSVIQNNHRHKNRSISYYTISIITNQLIMEY